MTEPAALPQLFSCERLSARLTVKACGARYIRVRASSPGSQDYDSACDQCPIGAHHAAHGTLCPDTTTQTPAAATPTSTTSTTTKETTMGAISEYTDEQKREAAKRVLIGRETREDVAKSMGVSGTTVSNWIKRFGHEVAGDAMESAAKPTRKAKKAASKKVAKAKLLPPDAVVTRDARCEIYVDPAPDAPPQPVDIDRAEADRLATELSQMVRHISDHRARTAVADAAWFLAQVAS